MLKNLKQKLKNKLLSYLFGVSPDDIFTVDASGRPLLDGELVTYEEFSNLEQEAKYIKSTRLWKILTNTLYSYGQKHIFEKSKTLEDLISGKMILYTVDVQQKIVYNITNEYKKAQERKKQKDQEDQKIRKFK